MELHDVRLTFSTTDLNTVLNGSAKVVDTKLARTRRRSTLVAQVLRTS
jgi:hypothetical protein